MTLRQRLAIATVTVTAALSACGGGSARHGEMALENAGNQRGAARIERDEREIGLFRARLESLHAIDHNQNGGAFRSLAGDLFSSMEREVEQAKQKTKHAREDQPNHPDGRCDVGTAASREDRMREIFDECKGLRWGVARGNDEAINRGLVLLDQFLGVMEHDLVATRRELGEDMVQKQR